MEFLRHTKSVCPKCLKSLDAILFRKNEEIILSKHCDLHGTFNCTVWHDFPKLPAFENAFAKNSTENLSKLIPLSTKHDCPHNCGICPLHEQSTCTVLLELTKSCNLNCPICFADAKNGQSMDFESLEQILSKLEFIHGQASGAILQLSGGEPTLYPYLIDVVKEASKLFQAVQLNTNGILLGQDQNLAIQLKKAGLSWVFLQFDTLNDQINLKMRGAKLFEIKQRAIENCKQAGLGLVLVCTIAPNLNDFELGSLLDFSINNFPTVRGLHFQPMTLSGRNNLENQEHLTIPQTIQKLAKQNNKFKVEDAAPSDCEHIRCSFHARYFIDEQKEMKYIQTKNSFSSEKNGLNSVIENAPKRSISSIKRYWHHQDETENIDNSNHNKLKAFDEFIKKAKNQTFSISCMAFQDVYNLDLQRLKQCCIHIYAFHDNTHKLIPFCAYNLTSENDNSLYRDNNVK